MIEYTKRDFIEDCDNLAFLITSTENIELKAVYGIPKGGIPLAIAMSYSLELELIELADFSKYKRNEILVCDDLIDSGQTIEDFMDYPVAVLGMKPHSVEFLPKLGFSARQFPAEWIHFFWEEVVQKDNEAMITRLLEFIGENPKREGLIETPKRVIKSFDRLYGGYNLDPKDIMKTFTEGACDDMVVLTDISFHSTCEHHMLPFSGKAHIGYIPDKKVIGVSKLARLLDIFARRLQIQERIGEQVTEALMKHLKPHGAVCVLEARHHCMTSRGVEQQTTVMITSSVRGIMKDQPATRAEFMGLIR